VRRAALRAQTGSLPGTAARLFKDALRAVEPHSIISRSISVSGRNVRIRSGGVEATYRDLKRVFLLGIGKASVPMAQAAAARLGGLLERGIITSPYRDARIPRVKVFRGGHPVPNGQSVEFSRSAIELLESAGEGDLVLALVSGGGSAAMALPALGITLAEKRRAVDLLLRSGAGIGELNCVRKHISGVKGGRLALSGARTRIACLILSDVEGDDPGTIASGPFHPDTTCANDALAIISKYGLARRMPEAVIRRLRNESRRGGMKPLREFGHVRTFIAANNLTALMAAERGARRLGFNTVVLSSSMCGEVGQMARFIGSIAREAESSSHPARRPACVLSGGEAEVLVHGRGRGGRNTELCLRVSLEIRGIDDVLFLSAGTDGIDGNCDAAGAWCTGGTVKKAIGDGLDPAKYIDDNDSHEFFRRAGGLVVTGPTGTNVMDVRILLLG
jgi:glycerate 2-kinase